MKQLGSLWLGFHEIYYLKIFWQSVKKTEVLLKSDEHSGYFTWIPVYIYGSNLTELFLKWEKFQTRVVEKINTHFISITFSPKFCHLHDNVEKYCIARQATYDNINMVHVHCMLDN